MAFALIDNAKPLTMLNQCEYLTVVASATLPLGFAEEHGMIFSYLNTTSVPTVAQQ